MAIQEPTDSGMVLAYYEHTVTQNKSNTGIIYLNTVVKNIAGTTENNTYNYVQ